MSNNKSKISSDVVSKVYDELVENSIRYGKSEENAHITATSILSELSDDSIADLANQLK